MKIEEVLSAIENQEPLFYIDNGEVKEINVFNEPVVILGKLYCFLDDYGNARLDLDKLYSTEEEALYHLKRILLLHFE